MGIFYIVNYTIDSVLTQQTLTKYFDISIVERLYHIYISHIYISCKKIAVSLQTNCYHNVPISYIMLLMQPLPV